MFEKESRIWSHYQKLQESLSELLHPEFGAQARSFTLIILNQTYTHTERLYELVEETTSLSKNRQATLAKLAHHIENTKDSGMNAAFLSFIKVDLTRSLTVIRELFHKDFDLAS